MHHSPVNYPLALIPDADPVIESYARAVMKRAFAARERLKAQISRIEGKPRRRILRMEF